MGVAASFTSLALTATKSRRVWKEAIVYNLISDILLCMSTSRARMFNFYLQQKVCESTDALAALLNAFEPEVGSSSVCMTHIPRLQPSQEYCLLCGATLETQNP